MSKASLDDLLELIGHFPDGTSLEQLMLGMAPPISRRTLQRWLSLLVQEGRLQAIGQARARRYKIRPLLGKEPIESSLPLSVQAKELRAKVMQPMQGRHPVSYHREFLESYLPNKSAYLPETLRSKLALLGGTRNEEFPAGTYVKLIFHRLLIDLSWNSSRLEGNTYSLLETERLLDQGTQAKGKDLQETQMLLNHKAAIEFLISSAEEIGVTRYTILNVHTLLSDNLLPDPAACGRLRHVPVGIEKSVYLPLSIPQVIEECFDLILQKSHAIENPFEQAFFLMVHLPYLQPFDDVNKRTSRLAANIPFIRHNLCPLSFIDVPQEEYINGLLGVYEFNRIELLRDVFEWAYERSAQLYSVHRQTLGQPDPLRLQYRDSIREAVKAVVLSGLNKGQAAEAIRTWSQEIKPADRERWIEVIERELLSLHEGNIARYQLQPKDLDLFKVKFF
jgi:fido (protein-threonine AMPylation protein)